MFTFQPFNSDHVGSTYFTENDETTKEKTISEYNSANLIVDIIFFYLIGSTLPPIVESTATERGITGLLSLIVFLELTLNVFKSSLDQHEALV